MATDIIMMMVSGGNPIAAESQVTIDTTDEFMTGFAAGSFFEVTDFDLAIKLVDNDTKTEAPTTDASGKKVEAKKSGGFSGWMQGGASGQNSALVYQAEMDTTSVTRFMDKASPLLFQNCFRSKSYDSATLVKRRIGLGTSSTTTSSFPYLRVDFTDVLLVGVDWDAEDPAVKEKLKFVCRSIAVKYRQQKPDGTPGSTIGGDTLSLVKRT